jgi:hypothetical protein
MQDNAALAAVAQRIMGQTEFRTTPSLVGPDGVESLLQPPRTMSIEQVDLVAFGESGHEAYLARLNESVEFAQVWGCPSGLFIFPQSTWHVELAA